LGTRYKLPFIGGANGKSAPSSYEEKKHKLSKKGWKKTFYSKGLFYLCTLKRN